MKTKIFRIIIIAILAISIISLCACTNDEPDANIADKILKEGMVSRYIKGTAYDPYIGSTKDEENVALTLPSIEQLKGSDMFFENWMFILFTYKTSNWKITRVTFNLIAMEDCTLNIQITDLEKTKQETFSIFKIIEANDATTFDFPDLNMQNATHERFIIRNAPPDDMSWQEYEQAGGYSVKWKITNLHVYGEKI